MENESTNIHQEYTELSTSIRHYSALRFAIVSVYFALCVGLINIVFVQQKLSLFISTALKIGGFLITIAFWIYEWRLSTYMAHFEKRMVDLERYLNYNIYSGRRQKPKLPLISFPNATNLLYCSAMIFWVLTFLIV